jgi:hypothetical protein
MKILFSKFSNSILRSENFFRLKYLGLTSNISDKQNKRMSHKSQKKIADNKHEKKTEDYYHFFGVFSRSQKHSPMNRKSFPINLYSQKNEAIEYNQLELFIESLVKISATFFFHISVGNSKKKKQNKMKRHKVFLFARQQLFSSTKMSE